MPPTDPKNSKDDLENLGMGELLDIYEKRMSNFAEGDIVRGKVLKITPSEAVIDIGYKSEGLLPIGEVTGFDNTVGSYLFTANQAGGTFSFSSSQAAGVPDGGTTIALLGLALVGVGAVRRKLNV